MTLIGGADGCPAGWLVVEQDTGTRELRSRVVGKVEDIFGNGRDLAVLAIDIPIGLTTSGPRDCDVLARRRLGPRASSVFPAAIRPVLSAQTYEDANQFRKRARYAGSQSRRS